MKDAVRRSDVGKNDDGFVYHGIWRYCDCPIYWVHPQKYILDIGLKLI